MRKTTLIRSIMSTFVAVMLAVFMIVPSFAALDPSVASYVLENPNKLGEGYIVTDSSKAAKDANGEPLFIGSDSEGNTYYIASGSSEAALTTKVGTLNRMSSGVQGVEIPGLQANTGEAMQGISGALPIINIILGYIIIIITVFLTLFTMIDILWIVFPVFRGGPGQSGEGGDGKKFSVRRVVSDDAVKALNKATQNGEGSGKNPIIIYLGSRIVAYIAVAIALFIFATGNINLITNIFLKMVTSFMEMLSRLS